jgi:hypothetical protein
MYGHMNVKMLLKMLYIFVNKWISGPPQVEFMRYKVKDKSCRQVFNGLIINSYT